MRDPFVRVTEPVVQPVVSGTSPTAARVEGMPGLGEDFVRL